MVEQLPLGSELTSSGHCGISPANLLPTGSVGSCNWMSSVLGGHNSALSGWSSSSDVRARSNDVRLLDCSILALAEDLASLTSRISWGVIDDISHSSNWLTGSVKTLVATMNIALVGTSGSGSIVVNIVIVGSGLIVVFFSVRISHSWLVTHFSIILNLNMNLR